MKDINVRHIDMGRRVDDFVEANAAKFPVGSRAAELIAVIKAAVTAMETAGAKQDAAALDGRQATDERDASRLTLLGIVRPINRTARGMEKIFPGISVRFGMPRGGDQNLINRARAFKEEATPIADEFTNRGMPVNFLTPLEPTITALLAAINRQNEALAAQTAATAAIKAAQQQLVEAVHEFSPIVRNTFIDDPGKLAAWKSASRVERAPKKKKTATPPTPPPVK